mmetsp:Transcript_37869/g.77254  ORF Transcript_37869/g.77254 Transcript_37869/m.77254 type:complete len:322 (-) Transcript_37869:121-1086(-)
MNFNVPMSKIPVATKGNGEDLSVGIHPKSMKVVPGYPPNADKWNESRSSIKSHINGANGCDQGSKYSPHKPKRPLNAFNLFYQHERARILLMLREHKSVDAYKPPSRLTTESIRQCLENNPFHVDQRKRRHRKSHGKISFSLLTKYVIKSWKGIDKVTRDSFQELANENKKRYLREVEHFKAQTQAISPKRIQRHVLPSSIQQSISPNQRMESSGMQSTGGRTIISVDGQSCVTYPAKCSLGRENLQHAGMAHQILGFSLCSNQPSPSLNAHDQRSMTPQPLHSQSLHSMFAKKIDIEPNQPPFSCTLDVETISFLKSLDW